MGQPRIGDEFAATQHMDHGIGDVVAFQNTITAMTRFNPDAWNC